MCTTIRAEGVTHALFSRGPWRGRNHPEIEDDAGREAAYHAGLRRALEAGEAVLRKAGSAFDAVTEAVCALEDEPLFNAGRGAVFTDHGEQEMDAAVMDGRDRRAGTVASIFGPKTRFVLLVR
nr:isoaspartyl peptidase/L-asparaginase [Marinicella sp. W31]MDC2876225.1 isoaspartyl peptidase/L-asparaginase [Marinicella sp. W31]